MGVLLELIEKLEAENQSPLTPLGEEALRQQCPPPRFFEVHNPWVIVATKVYVQGAVIEEWKWRKISPYDRSMVFGLFHLLGSSKTLEPQIKCAIGGWILSDLLEEIPVHIPVQKTN